jgi:hypothetical protein
MQTTLATQTIWNMVRLKTFVSPLLMGAGWAYAREENTLDKHFPIIVFMPSAYAGYQVYKNRNAIGFWLAKTVK